VEVAQVMPSPLPARPIIGLLAAVLWLGTSAEAQPPKTKSGSPPPRPATSLESKLQVYDQSIANLQKALALIERSANESNNQAKLGIPGLLVAKTAKAFADGFVGAAGELSGPNGKAVKAAYGAIQSSYDFFQASTPLAKTAAATSVVGSIVDGISVADKLKNAASEADQLSKRAGPVIDSIQTVNKAVQQNNKPAGADRNYIAAGGSAIKALTGMIDLAVKDIPEKAIGSAKAFGEVTQAVGDGIEAYRENASLKSEQKAFTTEADQMKAKINEAIAVFAAKKQVLIEQQASASSPTNVSGRGSTSSVPAGQPSGYTSRDDSNLVVKAITDPKRPTKIEVLKPPGPSEIGLQDPLSKSPQIATTAAQPHTSPPNEKTSLPPGWKFDPASLSKAGYAGWQKAQAALAAETLSRSATGASTALPPGFKFDPASLSNAGYAGWQRNQAAMGAETLSLSATGASTALPSGFKFDPSALSKAGYAGWQKNQAAIGAETQALSARGAGTSLPTGWTFNPGSFSAAETAGWQTNQEKMHQETIARSQTTSLIDSIWKSSGLDAISGSSGFGYPTTTRQSADGRLTATTQWSFRNTGGLWPQATSSWAVYDRGQYVGAYDKDVALLGNGQFRVLTTPGASALLTTDGKPRAPEYSTFDSRSVIENRQYSQQNAANLKAGGYSLTVDLGSGRFAGTKGTGQWDLLDTSGNKVADAGYSLPKSAGRLVAVPKDVSGQSMKLVDTAGKTVGEGYAQVKPLGGGASAVNRDPAGSGGAGWDILDANGTKIAGGFYLVKDVGGMAIAVTTDPMNSSGWKVLDLGGHEVGDGGYGLVEVKGGRVHVAKNGWSYLDVPNVPPPPPPAAVVSVASLPPAQSAVPLPAVGGQPAIPLPAVGGQSTPPPDTGGIYLGGEQQLKETKGIDRQFEYQRSGAEVIPRKKK
jgi:hypothetical protein